MGNLGATEILLIFLVVLLLFGARRIPEIARGLGKGIREFKDATTDIKRELTVDESMRPGLPPQGQTYARQPVAGPVADPAAVSYAQGQGPAYAPPATPGAPGYGATVEGTAAASPYVTGDPAHDLPSTGTPQAPIPPAAANDSPPPRTDA